MRPTPRSSPGSAPSTCSPRPWERPDRGGLAIADRGPPSRIELGAQGNVLRVDGTEVDLSRRHASRRILAALCDAHHRGEDIAASDLIEAGWPGERIRTDSARMRLHTTIRSLRQLGLSPWLQTREAGYRLDPSLIVVRTP